MLFVGFAAIAVVLFGLPAFAAEQPTATPIGPFMESGKDLSDPDLSMPQTDRKAGELTKEMEKPMRVPDTIDEQAPEYRPLCGPSKHAIHHYACGGGYDSY